MKEIKQKKKGRRDKEDQYGGKEARKIHSGRSEWRRQKEMMNKREKTKERRGTGE